jgi:hypothetical protein
MDIKTIFTVRKILTPFIVIYFSGFIGIKHFKRNINKLHNKAIKENQNDIWFTKKAIFIYLNTAFFSFINLFAWILSIYFVFR